MTYAFDRSCREGARGDYLRQHLWPKGAGGTPTSDRGVQWANWIVKGRTASVGFSKQLFAGFHIYIDKTTGEVRDITTMAGSGKLEVPEETKRILIKAGWRARRKTVLGVPPFPPDVSPALEINAAMNGGLVNTPTAAIAYARVLMRMSPRLKPLSESALHAEERDHVWHVTAPMGIEILSFSRFNGKVVSGDLS